MGITNLVETSGGPAGLYAQANANCGVAWGYVKTMTEEEFLDHMKSKIRSQMMGQGANYATGEAGVYGYITIDHVVDVIVSNLRLFAIAGWMYPDYVAAAAAYGGVEGAVDDANDALGI